MAPPHSILPSILVVIHTVSSLITPTISQLNLNGVKKFRTLETANPYFREATVDESGSFAYVGAKSAAYKIPLSSATDPLVRSSNISENLENRPDFKNEQSEHGKELEPGSEYLAALEIFTNRYAQIHLKLQDLLSQTYKLPNITFGAQCRRQVRALKQYYGDNLMLPLDADLVCSRHIRGLTLLPNGKLFTLKTGVFGTMPASLTGVPNYQQGWPRWQSLIKTMTYPSTDPRIYFFGMFETPLAGWRNSSEINQLIADTGRTCYFCNYSRVYSDCSYDNLMVNNGTKSANERKMMCQREYAIPNHLSIEGFADSTPSPTRTILTTSNMQPEFDGPLDPTGKESYKNGHLASSFLAGYHPDQVTRSFYSASGNGEGSSSAIYILTEIGQEKQLDANHEAFFGYEEPIPTGTSVSLALVRMELDESGDVASDKILISNPFKHSWVTSPATKFGRMVKTASQTAVPHRPRAIALYEDDQYIYFFFREVEWEGLNLPEYTINRNHYLWKTYDRAVSFPWEELYIPDDDVLQFEKTEPHYYAVVRNEIDMSEFAKLKQIKNKHVYAPTKQSMQEIWKQSKMVSRVGRVCKSDQGLPMGVQDASYFNLDNNLSLSAFQTFLKAKLTCKVKAKAIARTWRQRKDNYNHAVNAELSQRKERQLSLCNNFYNFGCVKAGVKAYDSDFGFRPNNTELDRARRLQVFCDRSLKGKDAAFRGFMEYSWSIYHYAFWGGMYKPAVNDYIQTRWSYEPNMETKDVVEYEYTELRDLQRLGDDLYYGVFTSPLAEERLDEKLPYGTAICTFTKEQIERAFSGPFKKRLNNAWRPHDPDVEGNISPNPRSCDPDPVRDEAVNVERMTVDFTDESLPLEMELHDFDMRNKSQRLNYFEKDVEGSRTMWNSVESEALMTTKDYIYTKIVTQTTSSPDLNIFYLATEAGQIHKIVVWTNNDTACWKPSGQSLKDWWQEETQLRNNSWGVDYFKMTQESLCDGDKDDGKAEDYLYTSQWACNQTRNGHQLLAIYEPFSKATKIWDFQITNESLLMVTDAEVMTLPLDQCTNYAQCTACSRDPHCGWNVNNHACYKYADGLLQGLAGQSADCSQCRKQSVIFTSTDTILLDASIDPNIINSAELMWYYNDELLTEDPSHLVITRNGSLLIINAGTRDEGVYTVTLPSENACIVSYTVQHEGCTTDKCLYEQKYNNWCEEYRVWKENMYDWELQIHESGCAKIEENDPEI